MGTLRNFVTPLHESSKRDYLQRMTDDKVKCMLVAKKYGIEYWDGNRRYGYGGYKYIPGRWKSVAQAFVDTYELKPESRVLDVGCGKGYLLHEMLLLEPELQVKGFDISKTGIEDSTELVKPNLFLHKAQDKLPFDDDEFDLVISLGTLHNLRLPELKISLEEIQRVGKQAYIMLESYRNEQELFNLQCWALTCESFFDETEWIWLYEQFRYKGDYEFIYFK
jgi:ubiquinone/menaquinone biosynthesis C-methylase UbiE